MRLLLQGLYLDGCIGSRKNTMTDFKLGQIIYAPTKTGNVKTWCCNVQGENPTTVVMVTQTKLDGKPVIRRDVITQGKNIGKSNETTPYEQAVSEAVSRYRKKIKQGYKTEIPTDTSKANHNALGFPKPMLAKPAKDVKSIEFPAHWQPKLDGHRAIVTKKDGEMVMYSRRGDLIKSMGHILRHLEDSVDEGMLLDGELYVHGEMLQNIGSLIRREQADSIKVEYHVYDMMMDVTYMDRFDALCRVVKTSTPSSPVKLVRAVHVDSMEEAIDLTDKAIDEGYEGGILRIPDDGYLAGYRSSHLLKIKKFDDSEYVITGVKEGKDRIVNDTDLKVAVFVCETPEGLEFDCTAFGDQYEKDRIWHNREDYIGKVLTVKHSGYTKEKKPWHPVSLRIREDI